MQPETKICQNCKGNFIIEPDDFSFYDKIKVPPPTFCPECRLIRRLSWFNQRSLYKRKCDKTGKDIMSVYAPDKPFVVYGTEAWFSDEWEGKDYGVEYDPSKSFFVQFDKLLKRVPLMNLFGLFATVSNSPFVNMVAEIKNCYMVTYCDFSENITYGAFVNNSKDSVDNLIIDKGELCYESVNCIGCYRSAYSVDCESCHDIWFSKNCRGCSDCYGCVNLSNKKYCIWNKQYTKEEYKEWIQNNLPQNYPAFQSERQKIQKMWQNYPVKYYHGTHNVDVTGDYAYHSKNAQGMYIVTNVEDSKWCMYVTAENAGLKDSYDFLSFGISSQRLYESSQVGNQASDMRFCWLVFSNIYNCEYSVQSYGIKNCFGCIGLKNKEYCILNKQYSKEEYEKLRKQIIEDMDKNPYRDVKGRVYKYGEFFPSEMSPFGYNETNAQEFFPLEKEKALERGYTWYEKQETEYVATKSWGEIPNNIENIDDSILNEIFECTESGKKFRIVRSELEFLRRMKLPLPQLHPDIRHQKRIQLRNTPKYYHRICQCTRAEHSHGDIPCANGFETSYSPTQPEIVYCESCYQQEVY